MIQKSEKDSTGERETRGAEIIRGGYLKGSGISASRCCLAVLHKNLCLTNL